MLEAGRYAEAQREMVRVCLPFMDLWSEMRATPAATATSTSCAWSWSACRPAAIARPTRDVRERYRDRTRQMLLDCGVPNVVGTSTTRESAPATV